jgi:hypothetical protein
MKSLFFSIGLRSLRSIPSRPLLRERRTRARRNCMASPALVGGGAMHRSKLPSATALPDSSEKGGAEDGAVISKPRVHPGLRQAGAKGEVAMTPRRCDPPPPGSFTRLRGRGLRKMASQHFFA